MTRPKIYSLLRASTPGQMGGATKIEIIDCEKCGRRLKETLKQLGYEFDFWSGEDFIYLTPYYIVSERLKQALEAKELKGLQFNQVITDTEEYFEIDEEAYSQTLPNFYHLDIQGKADEEPIWYVLSNYDKCDRCAGEVSSYVPEVSDLITRAVIYRKEEDTSQLPKRRVNFNSWNGEDIFRADFETRRQPLITESFLEVLKEVNAAFMEETIYVEAEWI